MVLLRLLIVISPIFVLWRVVASSMIDGEMFFVSVIAVLITSIVLWANRKKFRFLQSTVVAEALIIDLIGLMNLIFVGGK